MRCLAQLPNTLSVAFRQPLRRAALPELLFLAGGALNLFLRCWPTRTSRIGKPIPWDRLWVFWVDERCVPPDSADSNYGAARDLLLDKVPMHPDHVTRIEGELDPEEAAARYETAIRAHYRLEGAEIPIFDLIQLGMGDDGHTASLFPHTQALHELGRIAVANFVPQQKQSHRVTLTWPVINAARDVVLSD